MQIVILGKNSDDKGTQLEKLTALILKVLGYTNISTNEINAGGSEIDVIAEFNQPSIKGNITRQVVCECKAYKSPISTTDWLKFLGKIFTKEMGGRNVDGCFIALSGANGNVRGHYRELRKHREDISLITGDDLYTLLKTQFNLQEPDEVIKAIEKLTSKHVINTSLCYYQNKIHWVVSFADYGFSIVTSAGYVLARQESEDLQTLIIDNTEYTKFVDLKVEQQALTRQLFLEKYFFSILLYTEATISFDELLSSYNTKYYTKEIGDVSYDEMKSSVVRLQQKGIVVASNMNITLKLLSENDITIALETYRFVLNEYIVIQTLYAENYSKFINENLLKAICDIQGNLKVPLEKQETCLQILKWSPKALGWALSPDPMIVSHRLGNDDDCDETNKSDISYFIQKLCISFLEDYKNQGLHKFMHDYNKIVELETKYTFKAKSNSNLIIDTDFQERLMLALMSEEYGNALVLIRLLGNQLEPWERRNDNRN